MYVTHDQTGSGFTVKTLLSLIWVYTVSYHEGNVCDNVVGMATTVKTLIRLSSVFTVCHSNYSVDPDQTEQCLHCSWNGKQ